MIHEPSYIALSKSGKLRETANRLLKNLESCTLCPRQCKVNRLKGEMGICKTGRYASVSSVHAHFGEEPPLVGFNGSGTVFITSCSLMCNFCQNYEVSHLGEGQEVPPVEFAAHILSLQWAGCHNINFVTPTHVIPQIVEAVAIAVEQGLNIPLVYNSSGYDNPETLGLIQGIFDIYMPDLKFFNPQLSAETCNAPDYADWAKNTLREMYRQVGDLQVDEQEIAYRGLIVRHLVLPGQLSDTQNILTFIAEEISPLTYTNLMPQFRPCGAVSKHPVLGRRLTKQEFEQAQGYARSLGLRLAE